MKLCTRCREEKDESEFYFRTDEQRLFSHCKECTLASAKKRYIPKPPPMLTYDNAAIEILAHMHANPERKFFLSHAQVLKIFEINSKFFDWADQHDLQRVKNSIGFNLTLKPKL